MSPVESDPIGLESVAFASAAASAEDARRLAACREQQAAEHRERERVLKAAAGQLDAMAPGEVPSDPAEQRALAEELAAPAKAVPFTDCSRFESGGHGYVFRTEDHVVLVRFWVPVGAELRGRYEAFLREQASGS